MNTYERRYRSVAANLNIIHGELRRLIEDMGDERQNLTITELQLFSLLRKTSAKLDTLIKELNP